MHAATVLLSTSLEAQLSSHCRYGLTEAELQEVEEQLQEIVAQRQAAGGTGPAAGAAAPGGQAAGGGRMQRDAELLGVGALLHITVL